MLLLYLYSNLSKPQVKMTKRRKREKQRKRTNKKGKSAYFILGYLRSMELSIDLFSVLGDGN